MPYFIKILLIKYITLCSTSSKFVKQTHEISSRYYETHTKHFIKVLWNTHKTFYQSTTEQACHFKNVKTQRISCIVTGAYRLEIKSTLALTDTENLVGYLNKTGSSWKCIPLKQQKQ